MSLVEYLIQIQELVRNDNFDCVDCVVMGNQSADMDSMVSSLCMSILLSQIYQQQIGKAVVIPVIQIPKHQFKYRLDCRYIFNNYLNNEINLEDILFFSDTPFIDKLFSTFNTRLILVDHCELSGNHSLAKSVYSIIDHHADSKTLMTDNDTTILTDWKGWQGQRIRWVSHTGSCASMIGKLWKESIDKGIIKDMRDDVKMLLLTTIIKDTCGLEESLRGNRWNDLDEEIVNWLQEKLEIDIGQLWETIGKIQSNRELQKSLGLDGLFSSDMKVYHYNILGSDIIVVYSSMTIQLVELHTTMFDSIALESELQAFSKLHNAHVIILMSCSINESKHVERWFGFYIPNGVSHRDVILNLLTSLEFLQLQPFPVSPQFNNEYFLFKQGNVKASRKIVEPLIREKLDIKEC